MNNGTETIAPNVELLVADAADRFIEEVKLGRAPSIEAYARQYPEIAAIIRQIFPAFAVLAGSSETPCNAAPTGVTGSGSDDRPSGTLGDFRILAELGRGGMGVVYEAEQLSLGRRVALKVLPFAAMLDKQQLNRFKNEARAAATLDHPNIVAIYSVGCERGVHFYAMQLIEGRSLAEVVAAQRSERGVSDQEQDKIERRAVESQADSSPAKQGAGRGILDTAAIAHAPTTPDASRLTPRSSLPDFESREYFRAVARLGIQAAEALDHAHQNGILHRDIKPANLLVDDSGKLWVTDFGLARIEQDAGMTMTGDILGTLRYMSPEQALAKRVVVDHRSDIYSLGVTLYELLTLQAVFQGDDRQELLQQIAFAEPPKPRQLNPRIPVDLETIILKAIEKKPDDRYQTMQWLAGDLRAVIDDRAISASPPTMWQRSFKWSRRHPAGLRATIAAIVVSVLMLAVSVGWISRDRSVRELVLTQAVNTALTEARSWGESRRHVEALSAIQRADALLAASNAHTTLRQEVDQLRHQIETLRKLDEMQLTRGSQNPGNAVRAVFRDYGIDLNALSMIEAAERIRNSPIRIELVAALDDCSFVGTIDGSTDGRQAIVDAQLLKIANLADQNSWRARLRDSIINDDLNALLKLSRQGENVFQSPGISLLLARQLVAHDKRQEAIGVLKQAVSRFPNSFLLNLHIATCLRNIDPPRTDEAISYRRAAVALHPEIALAHNHLAVALHAAGHLDDAEAEHRESLRLDPQNALYSAALVTLLLDEGRRGEAEQIFQQTSWPTSTDSPRADKCLGEILIQLGRYHDAETAFRAAIEKAPLWGDAQASLGDALGAQAKYQEATTAYNEAIRLAPDAPRVLNQLAWRLATSQYPEIRDGQRAVELAAKVCERTNHENPGFLDTLAAACAESGDFESATKWSQKAIDNVADEASRDIFRRHLDQFAIRKPWRDTLEPPQAAKPKRHP